MQSAVTRKKWMLNKRTKNIYLQHVNNWSVRNIILANTKFVKHTIQGSGSAMEIFVKMKLREVDAGWPAWATTPSECLRHRWRSATYLRWVAPQPSPPATLARGAARLPSHDETQLRPSQDTVSKTQPLQAHHAPQKRRCRRVEVAWIPVWRGWCWRRGTGSQKVRWSVGVASWQGPSIGIRSLEMELPSTMRALQ